MDKEKNAMRILVVASYNSNTVPTYVQEQMDALKAIDVSAEFVGIIGKGIAGYLRARKALIQRIQEYKPDIVHAHYGLCGLLANFQRKVPVVTTYHGSDINVPRVLRFSRITMRFSAWNVFVSQRSLEHALGINGRIPNEEQIKKTNYTLLPCGVTLDDFPVRSYQEARQRLGWGDEKKILFAGSFSNEVKNPLLAKQAVALLPDVELIELRGFTREQVAILLSAVDAFLLTSNNEGSPQVVKEAMACGCPIVSVDVGDVAERITGVEKCYIAERTPEDIAAKLQLVLQDTKRTNGRQHILDMKLDNESTAKNLIEIYNNVLNK